MRGTHLTLERQTGLTDKDWPILYRFVAAIDKGFQDRLAQVLQTAIGMELQQAVVGAPEIEIARFEALGRMEDTLSRWTQRLCMENPSISLEVNNFSGIPPYTLFARVADGTPLKKLLMQLRKLDMYLTGNQMPPIQANNRFTINLSNLIPQKNNFDGLLYKIGRIEFHDFATIPAIHLQQLKGGQWHAVRIFHLHPTSSTIEMP